MSQRTVRFYEIVNNRKERLPTQLPFDDIRTFVNSLPDTDAYVPLARMTILGSAYEPSRGGPRSVPLLALDRIDRDVRLRIERKRGYRPLVLAEDEALAEPAFYSVFDRNVLGVMRNSGTAPGASSFRDYLNKLDILDGEIDVVPLADGNMLRALKDVGTLTKLDFAVGPDVAAEVFEGSPTLAGAIRAVRQNLGAATVEVIIKVDRSSGNAESALEEVRNVVQSPSSIGAVDRANIGYRRLEDGRASSHDFINEAVATATDVDLDADTSKPTEPSAAQAMAKAYDDLYDDIASSLKSLQ